MTKIQDVWLAADEFAALQDGDSAVFRKVFDKYCGLVQYVVGKCGISDADRDDVVQDVFVAFFRSVKTIEGVNSIKPWLCVAARNRSIDKIRATRKTDPDALETLADENEAYAAHRREIELSLTGELIEQIGREEDGGADFVAFYRDGTSVKDIAKRNGEAVSTVTTRMTRMRRKFSEMIRRHIEELRAASPY